MTDQPPKSVLRAFGVEVPPRPLAGGQGSSWVAGELVFKPGGDPVREWLAEALVDVVADGVRLAAPVRTFHGTWSWEGWTATRWVEGSEPDRTKSSSWLDILEAGRAFHRAVAHLDRPDCLDARDDWWAVADRAAWGEHVIEFRPEFADLSRRRRHRRCRRALLARRTSIPGGSGGRVGCGGCPCLVLPHGDDEPSCLFRTRRRRRGWRSAAVRPRGRIDRRLSSVPHLRAGLAA